MKLVPGLHQNAYPVLVLDKRIPATKASIYFLVKNPNFFFFIRSILSSNSVRLFFFPQDPHFHGILPPVETSQVDHQRQVHPNQQVENTFKHFWTLNIVCIWCFVNFNSHTWKGAPSKLHDTYNACPIATHWARNHRCQLAYGESV